MHRFFICVLIISALFIAVAVLADLCVNFKEGLYGIITKVLRCFGYNWYKRAWYIKNAISENIEEFYGTLMTITTILAATVIFFYSVQDNKREGIPHRTILAYSFGSYTIPVYFLLSMFILPVSFWLFHFNMKKTFIVCTVVSYFLQMAIIALILFSTSHTCGLCVIRNAEIRQYKMLCKIKKENSNNLNSSSQFIWTYLMHHLEQAITSDELIADKTRLVKELLKVPFYEKEFFFFPKNKNCGSYVDGMSKACLEKNDLKRIYEYYYGNLSAVIEHLSKTENSSERSRIYLILYEFLDSLQKLYCEADDVYRPDSSAEAMQNYVMVISGMMNAVLGSGVPDAEGFCNYVLNKCLKDEEMRKKQIGLYFLFQEYLYRTYAGLEDNQRLIPIQYYTRIRGIAKWSMNQDDERLYYDFWQIWMDWTTFSEFNSINIFKEAIAALKGEKFNASLASYIMLSIKHMEKNTYEIKSDPINK